MLELPPKDAHGNVRPHDHAQILGEHKLIRGINEQWIVVDASGKRISSSMAYKPYEGGMSVELMQLIEADGKDPVKRVKSNPKWVGAVTLLTSDLRALHFKVGYSPIEGASPNPYHAEVWGDFKKNNREIAARAKWLA